MHIFGILCHSQKRKKKKWGSSLGTDMEISSENIVNIILVQYAIFCIRTGEISTYLCFFALSALRFIKSIKKLIKVTTDIPQKIET